MDDFLTPVSTTKLKQTEVPKVSKPLLQVVESTKVDSQTSQIDSSVRALEALKEQPNYQTVCRILKFLSGESQRTNGFNLILPDPTAANIVYQLVNTTIPDYWHTLQERGLGKELSACFRNPCGLGNIITRLRTLIADCRQKKPDGTSRDSASHIEDLLNILDHVLTKDGALVAVWDDVEKHAKTTMQRKMIWKEFVGQVASGRILSLVAEAEDVLRERRKSRTASWVANGNTYASWLGSNIAKCLDRVQSNEAVDAALIELSVKALSLGYTDHVVCSMFNVLIETKSINKFVELLGKMKAFEQRKFFLAALPVLADQYLDKSIISKDDAPLKSSPSISAVAVLISSIAKDNDILKAQLVTSLTKSPIPGTEDLLAFRRSMIAAVAQDEDNLHTLLESSIKLFGDSYYTKHTPILQQEALAQTLALTCGYVQRTQPMFVTMMAKSSHHVSGMSNRIGSSSPRARFLGIAIGMAISKLVDKPELQLKFDLEGDESEEAAWLQRLTATDDKLGSIDDLRTPSDKGVPAKQSARKTKPVVEPVTSSSSTTATSVLAGPRVVEILSDSDSDSDPDDDLTPYSKPDSDAEDDTDDPTEINRNKPTAPVYIRDLLTSLRDTENYDAHQLALQTAAPLIRRKANFGTEVTDHLDELATVLAGLHDVFELDNFAQMQQQALIAVLLARPATVAPWLARAFFTGDYSVTQRTAILTALGLGARTLAGLKDDATDDLIPPEPSFPSKQLPPHLHAVYSASSTTSSPQQNKNKTKTKKQPQPLAHLTTTLTQTLLSPLAQQAASSLSGPAILHVDKTRTFSSRMAVEARRSKPVPNALSQVVAQSFFFPLTGRWWVAMRNASASHKTESSSISITGDRDRDAKRGAEETTPTSTSTSLLTTPHLLPAYLQTLSLILSAAGPSTPLLPQMTRELWDLLLALRTLCAADKRCLSALLFALLMLLETNANAADKGRVASEQGAELLETLAWARGVFEGLPKGADGGEDERVRVLAAGVVVRCQEVVEGYQQRLVGRMVDY